MNALNFRETEGGKIEINVDKISVAWFLQRLMVAVLDCYLGKRTREALKNAVNGHSHWIEHVFLPRVLDIYGNDTVTDDHFFNSRMLTQLEERVTNNSITQSLSDNYVLGLIERNFVFRFSRDGKSIIIFFSETHKGVDFYLQDILKEVLRKGL